MSTIVNAKYKHRRGTEPSMPTLLDGEIYVCSDTDRVYKGTTSGNKCISDINQMNKNTQNILGDNKLINGNFDIWQRGTSFTNPSVGTYSADRWLISSGKTTETFPNITITRQAITPGEILNSKYFYRINADGVGSNMLPGSYYYISQTIENGARLLAGLNKKINISFKARSSIPNRKIGLFLAQNYGSGGTPTSTEIINGNNFTLSSAWQTFSLTITLNDIANKVFGTNNDDFIQILFSIVNGDTYSPRIGTTIADFGGAGNIDIAQVQVNIGDVALPFNPRSVADELRLCQRYCYTIPNGTHSRAVAIVSNDIWFTLALPTDMRVNPVLVSGLEVTDWCIYNTSSTSVSGFGLSVGGGNSQVLIHATKTSHGLSDGFFKILSEKNYLDAEL